MDIDQTLTIIRKSKQREKFVSLYDRGGMNDYPDHDTATKALCAILAFYFRGDTAAMDEAFRGSALYYAKWEYQPYREQTLQEAVALCGGEFYRGRGRPAKEQGKYFTPEILASYLAQRGGEVRFNDLTKRNELTGFEDLNREHIQANIAPQLYSELQGQYEHCTIQTVGAYLDIISSNNCFNPVLDLLTSTSYDGGNHLETLFEIMGITEDAFSRTLVSKWLWQTVSLLRNEASHPFGADGVLVLVGAQGVGKTSLFRKLALQPDFFKEGQSIDFRDKDSYIRCLSCWIAELGEVEATLKSDTEKLKTFVTNGVDAFRRPYGRGDVQFVRRTSLCGTCNSSEFLIDNTGNRRFWTVPVAAIDLDRLATFDALQLWKQTEQYALAMPQGFRLTPEEREELDRRNSQHERKMRGQQEIEDILSTADEGRYAVRGATVTEFKLEHASLAPYSAAQISKTLDRMGYQMTVTKVKGTTKKLRQLPMRL